VKVYRAHFFGVMASAFKNLNLICACVFLLLAGNASINAAPLGFVEGHLKIVSPKEVELADGNTPAITGGNYTEYPLIILSQDEKREIVRVTADGNGNYHVALPPGNYVLDVQGRAPGHLRAKPQRFTVVSNQTVRVDMDVDTGIR
jgi:carboxypeptidase family protein